MCAGSESPREAKLDSPLYLTVTLSNPLAAAVDIRHLQLYGTLAPPEGGESRGREVGVSKKGDSTVAQQTKQSKATSQEVTVEAAVPGLAPEAAHSPIHGRLRRRNSKIVIAMLPSAVDLAAGRSKELANPEQAAAAFMAPATPGPAAGTMGAAGATQPGAENDVGFDSSSVSVSLDALASNDVTLVVHPRHTRSTHWQPLMRARTHTHIHAHSCTHARTHTHTHSQFPPSPRRSRPPTRSLLPSAPGASGC